MRLHPLALLLLTLPLRAQPSAPATPSFQGKLLLALSDTDLLPSAYIDGKLGPAAGPDVLSIMRIADLATTHPAPLSTLPASNSVAGPPACLAVTPDGRYALAIETFAARQTTNPSEQLSSLAEGHTLRVIDLHDPAHPTLLQTVETPPHPLSVSINHDGTLVAVAFGSRDPHAAPSTYPPLLLYRFNNGHLSAATTSAVPGFSARPGDPHPDELISAEFHPTRNTLALVYFRNPRLSLVDVGPTLSLSAWGNEVELDRQPFLARSPPTAASS